MGCHFLFQCMKVKSESEVAQSCPTLCDPMDCSPPGSSVHGIFQTTPSNLKTSGEIVSRWGGIGDPTHHSSSLHGIFQARVLEWVPLPSHKWDLTKLKSFFKEKENESFSVMSNSLQTARLLCPWNSLGHNTGVGSLQGIFPAQGSNPGLPHCRQILYHLSYQGRKGNHKQKQKTSYRLTCGI